MARKRYNKSKRVDMRKGGRVRLHAGGTQTEAARHQFTGVDANGNPTYVDSITGQPSHAPHTNNNNNTSSSPENPFPDTGNVPYGNVTEDQATKARTQIEDAAAGIIPKDSEAKIKDPEKIAREGTEIKKEDISTVGEQANARAATVRTPPRERVSTQRPVEPIRKQADRTAEDATVTKVADKTRGPKTAEGQVTREAGVDEIRALTQEAEAAGMPSDQALEKAKADVITGQLSAGAVAAKQTGVGGQMSDTPQAEAKSREAIT